MGARAAMGKAGRIPRAEASFSGVIEEPFTAGTPDALRAAVRTVAVDESTLDAEGSRGGQGAPHARDFERVPGLRVVTY